MQQIQHLIDGGALASTSGRTGAVFNPATAEQTGRVDLASIAEVDAVLASGSPVVP